MSEKCQQMIDQSIELHLAFQEEAQKVLETLDKGIIEVKQICDFAGKILEKNSKIFSIDKQLNHELEAIETLEEHPALLEKVQQRAELLKINDQICRQVATIGQEALNVVSLDMKQNRVGQTAMTSYKTSLSAH